MVDIENGIPSGFLQKVWRTKANRKRMVGLEAREAHVSSKIVRVSGNPPTLCKKCGKITMFVTNCHAKEFRQGHAPDLPKIAGEQYHRRVQQLFHCACERLPERSGADESGKETRVAQNSAARLRQRCTGEL
jgi:hypothetical protein